MQHGKWLANVDPNQPVSDVARQAIEFRLKTVKHYLRLSAVKAHKDDEYVHQLRVSTRRAQSALRIFSDVTPPRRSQWFEKKLKRLRGDGSKARDLDVLRNRLCRNLTDNGSALHGIVADLSQQRRRAQKPLIRAWKNSKRDDFGPRIANLLKRIRWRGNGKEPNFHRTAVVALRPVVDAFFTAGEVDLAITDNLHDLRIVGKKLRYTIELVSAGLDPSLRQEVYPLLADIQESLGDVNDHIVAKTLFESWLVQSDDRRTMAEIATLIAAERDAYLAARNEFDRWWNPDNVSRLKQQFDLILEDSTKASLAFPNVHRA